jgi:hypothetical protein
MQARGEEDRLNASRQSGYGGMEQQQRGSTQASQSSSPGSMQSADGASRQHEQKQNPASNSASGKSKKGSRKAGK